MYSFDQMNSQVYFSVEVNQSAQLTQLFTLPITNTTNFTKIKIDTLGTLCYYHCFKYSYILCVVMCMFCRILLYIFEIPISYYWCETNEKSKYYYYIIESMLSMKTIEYNEMKTLQKVRQIYCYTCDLCMIAINECWRQIPFGKARIAMLLL